MPDTPEGTKALSEKTPVKVTVGVVLGGFMMTATIVATVVGLWSAMETKVAAHVADDVVHLPRERRLARGAPVFNDDLKEAIRDLKVGLVFEMKNCRQTPKGLLCAVGPE